MRTRDGILVVNLQSHCRENSKFSLCNTILINFSEREVGGLASEDETGLEVFQHCVLIPRHQKMGDASSTQDSPPLGA